MIDGLQGVRWFLCLLSVAGCGFPRPANIGDDDPGSGGSDAGPDTPLGADAGTCYGSFLRICLLPPTKPLVISEATTIDTSNSPMCAALISGGDYCVIAATDISIFMHVRATGTKPLVFVATGTITTSAPIDVGSHRGEAPETGAGADPLGGCTAGTLPGPLPTGGDAGGGGAGGSYRGLGGSGGGIGGATGAGTPGIPATIDSLLRGGCPGQAGAGGGPGPPGHGGGAVYFIAGDSIVVGADIYAGGEGGGGGGAGGMIAFDAPRITGDSLIVASGGGGGEGAAPFLPAGRDGQDAKTFTVALGGAHGDDGGGDGGDGSSGIAGPGKTGTSGTDVFEGFGGGGGGGGGAGVVKAPTHATLGSTVSPPATP